MHADDATLLSSMLAKNKINDNLLQLKQIKLQLSKCEFICVNGSENDKDVIQLSNGAISNVNCLKILGSPLSQSGKLKDDLNKHFD